MAATNKVNIYSILIFHLISKETAIDYINKKMVNILNVTIEHVYLALISKIINCNPLQFFVG